MNHPKRHDHVRLTQAVPRFELRAGETGVVINIRQSPTPAYRVEFDKPGRGDAVRALLFPQQVECIESAADTVGNAVGHGGAHE